jgi:PhnB protein
MTEKIKSIPDAYHSINVYIAVNDAAQAIKFYQTAFGAQEKSRFAMPNGKIMHAELEIGDSTLQLSDEFQDHENEIRSPHSLNATSCIIHLYVQDADKVFEAAIKAGAKVAIQSKRYLNLQLVFKSSFRTTINLANLIW